MRIILPGVLAYPGFTFFTLGRTSPRCPLHFYRGLQSVSRGMRLLLLAEKAAWKVLCACPLRNSHVARARVIEPRRGQGPCVNWGSRGNSPVLTDRTAQPGTCGDMPTVAQRRARCA